MGLLGVGQSALEEGKCCLMRRSVALDTVGSKHGSTFALASREACKHFQILALAPREACKHFQTLALAPREAAIFFQSFFNLFPIFFQSFFNLFPKSNLFPIFFQTFAESNLFPILFQTCSIFLPSSHGDVPHSLVPMGKSARACSICSHTHLKFA